MNPEEPLAQSGSFKVIRSPRGLNSFSVHECLGALRSFNPQTFYVGPGC